MRANIARAMASGKQDVLEVTKEIHSGYTYTVTITVPELIGKQNVIANCKKLDGSYGIIKFICVPNAGGTIAFGRGQIGSYADGGYELSSAYDPDTGKLTTNGSNYSSQWNGTYTFYAW